MFASFFLLLFVVGVRGFPQLPPLSGGGSSLRAESFDGVHRRVTQSRPVHCSLDEVAKVVGTVQLQELVEAVAARKGISPYLILSRVLERMRSRQVMEENILNTLEGAALQELIGPVIDFPPSSAKLPPLASGAPYSIPPQLPFNPPEEDDTPLFIIPVSPSSHGSPLLVSPLIKSEGKPRHLEPPIRMGSLPPVPQFLPAIMTPPRSLKPLPGAIVRVHPGDSPNIVPDVTVTVSPFMTVIEALREAEQKYQNILGLSPDTDVISFGQSALVKCLVISRIDGTRTSDEHVWKVTITDRDGQVVYDDVCLPVGKEVTVKAGTVVSLSYVQL